MKNFKSAFLDCKYTEPPVKLSLIRNYEHIIQTECAGEWKRGAIKIRVEGRI